MTEDPQHGLIQNKAGKKIIAFTPEEYNKRLYKADAPEFKQDTSIDPVKEREILKERNLQTLSGQQWYLKNTKLPFSISTVGRGWSWAQTPPLVAAKEGNYWVDPLIKLEPFQQGLYSAERIERISNNKSAYIEIDYPKQVEYNVFAPFDYTQDKFAMMTKHDNIAIWGWNDIVYNDYVDQLTKN